MKKSAFVFIMKTEESFQNKNKKIRASHPLLEILNPNHYLYCICCLAKDYTEIGIQKNQKRPEFWATKKIYSFVTYYPLMEMFLEVISQMLGKLERKINKLIYIYFF
jgi:hypothetical protein